MTTKDSGAKPIPAFRRVTINSDSDMPDKYSATPGGMILSSLTKENLLTFYFLFTKGTLFSTTPGGKLLFQRSTLSLPFLVYLHIYTNTHTLFPNRYTPSSKDQLVCQATIYPGQDQWRDAVFMSPKCKCAVYAVLKWHTHTYTPLEHQFSSNCHLVLTYLETPLGVFIKSLFPVSRSITCFSMLLRWIHFSCSNRHLSTIDEHMFGGEWKKHQQCTALCAAVETIRCATWL